MIAIAGKGHQSAPARPGGKEAQPRAAVLLSQRLGSLGAGLDLAALQDWLETTLPDVRTHVGPDPGRRPGEVTRAIAASGAERLVLGLASGEYAAGEVQAQVRKAGLDPLGVGIVNLGAHAALLGPREIAMERAKLLLAAAIARARVFAGSYPEHLKTSLSVAVSRRALFTLSAHEYHAVPYVRTHRCAAQRGCRQCVEVCPQGAIRQREGGIEIEKARCEGCGLCLGACPSGAVEYPGFSAVEMDAQVGALLDPALGDLAPRGVLFVCRQTAAAIEAWVDHGFHYPAGWLPVAAPCTGMLSPALFLKCLALGAAGVGVIPCSHQCPFGQDAVVAERVAYCQELLGLIGGMPERVKLWTLTDEAPSTWALPVHRSVTTAEGEPPAPFQTHRASDDPRAAAEALLYLAGVHDAPAELTYAHAQSPFGVVELDRRACVGCEACAKGCPTGALVGDHSAAAVAISFDAALCTACGLCVFRCPDAGRGTLRVRREVDLARLAAGRTVLFRDETPRCLACGAPIAPAALMARVAELLGEQYGALAGKITRYCSDCRGGAFPPIGG